ncbi:FCD domain-containing protein [Sediminibacillus dalangtanensis]|uniref:FCD domain-containing protein n=1 Tax=Sediminibacillus dalangtanensis TaxID=2729421 RepID=A0ABX7VU37_9BACI|nr:GntR family transcriptional regulator [Sediminibacillus dalangtanensis]QTN00477.1 FCD domain-containing protein [Sediminibacillus dalangtanensis]
MEVVTISTTKRVNGSTRDFVYETVKQQIINWELEPGTKISEKEVAEKLEVSRTPVREAFMKLAQEELLGVYPQSGTRVSQIDLSLVEEGRFVRENIERAIVKEACSNFGEDQLFQLETNLTMQDLCLEKGTHHRLFELDEAFHRLLFEGSGKQRTWEMIRKMNTHFDRLRMLRLASNPDWNVLVSQHKEIFGYISKQQADLAEEAMRKHLHLVDFEKEELKERYPNYFK